MSVAELRRLVLALPGTEEGRSYGTLAFKVKGTLLVRLKEDGETIVLRVDPFEVDVLTRGDPETFFITDHYVGYPLVLVRLGSVGKARLRALVERSWRMLAPANVQAQLATKSAAQR